MLLKLCLFLNLTLLHYIATNTINSTYVKKYNLACRHFGDNIEF